MGTFFDVEMTSATGAGGDPGPASAAPGSSTPARMRPEKAAPTARRKTGLDKRLGTYETSA